jgi:hypothetical protein
MVSSADGTQLAEKMKKNHLPMRPLRLAMILASASTTLSFTG